METPHELLAYLKKFVEKKNLIHRNSLSFRTLNGNVKYVGMKVGFGEDEVCEVWKYILALHLDGDQLQEIAEYIIPRDTISAYTVDCLVSWCYTNAKSKAKSSLTIPILKWLIACISWGIIKSDDIEHCFYVFLNMVKYSKTRNEACFLIYIALNFNLINNYTVKMLLNYKGTYPKTDVLTAILSLCKRLKPHYFKKDITILPDEKDFIPKQCFSLIQKIGRWSLDRFQRPTIPRFRKWKLQTIAFCSDNDHPIQYLPELTILESIERLLFTGIKYSATSFFSLLNHPLGFLYIFLGDEYLKNATCLFLQDEFVKREENLLGRRTRGTCRFLKRVADMSQIFFHPLIPVQAFLRKNFKRYCHSAYIKEMLNLVCGITIFDYKEFFHEIIQPLHSIILKNDANISSLVIECLGEMIYRNVKYLTNKNLGWPKISPEKPESKDILCVLKCFQQFGFLCSNIHDEDINLLHKIVDSYILLSTLEGEYKIDYLLPRLLFFQIIISDDYVLVNKVAKILKRKFLSSPETRGNDIELMTQVSDLIMVYFKGIQKSSLCTEIFPQLQIDNTILLNREMINLLKLKNNTCFSPLLKADKEGSFGSLGTNDYLEFVTKLEVECSDLVELITSVTITMDL